MKIDLALVFVICFCINGSTTVQTVPDHACTSLSEKSPSDHNCSFLENVQYIHTSINVCVCVCVLTREKKKEKDTKQETAYVPHSTFGGQFDELCGSVELESGERTAPNCNRYVRRRVKVESVAMVQRGKQRGQGFQVVTVTCSRLSLIMANCLRLQSGSSTHCRK